MSTFEMNFTTDTGLPLVVGSDERSADGRVLTTTYKLEDASACSDSVPLVPMLIVVGFATVPWRHHGVQFNLPLLRTLVASEEKLR